MAEGSTLPDTLASSPAVSVPMIHGIDGVAELVWESGQPLARHPSRTLRLLSCRSSCPSQLDKLDSRYEDRIHASGKRPRLGDNYHNDQTSLEPMWVEPHVVPDYKDLDHHQCSGAAAFNDELVAKVPDHHQQQQQQLPRTSFHEFNIGWGPFGQMLMDNAKRQTSIGCYPYNELRPLEPATQLLRPSRLLKVGDASQGTHSCSTNSTNGPNSSSRLDRFMQGQKSSKALADGSSSIPVESTLVESGSKSVKALETRFDLLATGGATAKAVAPPDELSEAVSRDDYTRAKRAKTEANAAATAQDENPDDHRKESVCSLAASNDFELLKMRHHEDTAGMAQRGRKKKRRSAEVHSQSEKRRRAKINKKLLVLQDMIPNANKVDKASLLDEAIEYMKGLQLQLQIMAMGRGLMMHPMMLPGFQAPPMAQPPSMGMGMNTAAMGLGCTPTPLSNSLLLRFPEQMLPLSMPQLQPFSPMPVGGSSSKPSIPMPSVELQGSAHPFAGTRNAT